MIDVLAIAASTDFKISASASNLFDIARCLVAVVDLVAMNVPNHRANQVAVQRYLLIGRKPAQRPVGHVGAVLKGQEACCCAWADGPR